VSIPNYNVLSTSAKAVSLLVAVLISGVCIGQDWNQWQGADRNGVWHESGTLDKFPEDGPRVVWRKEIAGGYAGPAVSDGRVVVMDYLRTDGDATPNPGKRSELSGSERVICFDAKSGEEIWKYEYACEYKISYPAGPRATPTIDGDQVYTLGAEGMLTCLSMKDGSKVWNKDLKQEFGMEQAPLWGFSAHPLVDGDTLYCLVGGKGSVAVAFDKNTGQDKWKSLSAKSPGYCPPTMIEAGGTKQLIIWHPESLNSLNPETGETYWSFAMKPAYEMSIIAPIKSGNYLLATALQGTSLLLELDKDAPNATEVWRGKGIHSDHNPPLVVDGYMYGVSERGPLFCCELMSGKKVWDSMATTATGRPASSTTGFIVKNGDKYFIANEIGELIIAKMSPDGFQEIDRAKILEPTSQTGNRAVVWSHPAFSNKCVFARNDKELVCISLASEN